ncbi:MAG: prepilin-type N-terminal cleavage/methylation domain-containing protein [Gammaproteobacteria bacterium]|nr:prepilin-type N-terminal cleavage/methylation domain-containing protein [Gammaproteobacteria bacterium]
MNAPSGRKGDADAGLSLLELMVAVAILGIIAAIALPLYRGYVESAATGALVNDIATMEVFQEDVMLRTGSYAEGTYDARSGVTSLTDATGWRPRADTRVVYVVEEATPSSYRVTATDTDGRSICRVMPARTPC